MLLILLLISYLDLNYSVQPFVTHNAITNGLLNIKVDKWIITPSRIGKTQEWLKDHPMKLCSELFITGKESIGCTNIAHVM